MNSRPWVGVTLVKIACLYLMAALLLGLVMAVRHDYSLLSVHSHLGLLGWASLAITGLVYVVLPACARTKLAAAHFWLHNTGLPLMMGGLTFAALTGNPSVEPIIGLGSLLVIVSLLAFTVNVFRHAHIADAAKASTASLAG